MTWTGPGFVDHHTHLLRVSAGVRPPYDPRDPASIAAWHRSVAARGSTPMDEPPEPIGVEDLGAGLLAGLQRARSLGLVQITEAGMSDWSHWDALLRLRERGPLPVQVRVLVASGASLDVDRTSRERTGDPWLEIEGVKLYADGWVGPRTCALCEPFTDRPHDDGVLFLDDLTLARRAEPLASRGLRIATHAIGDRAVAAVLDGYEHVWGDDCAEAAPRIEHAQVLSRTLIDRMAGMGVVACVQPSFAVSDAVSARAALGEERLTRSYRWADMQAAGVRLIGGSDFPIEDLEPLHGLQRLVTGADLDGPVVTDATLPLDRALELISDPEAGTTTLDADPRTVDPRELHRIAVTASMPLAHRVAGTEDPEVET